MELSSNVYRPKQVRDIENNVINNGIPAIDLMHLAGAAVFDMVCKIWSGCTTLVVFCGRGNNAGDGYVVAKLALQKGMQVEVVALHQADQLSGDAYTAAQQYLLLGGRVNTHPNFTIPANSIVVDALFGIGLNRKVSDIYENAINSINASANRVISIDVPSGLNADTGCVMGCAVKADYTVCLIALKRGLLTGDAREYCGTINLQRLGLKSEHFSEVVADVTLIDKRRMPDRMRTAHKGHFGHVLLVGGDLGYSGAIRMAAESALRCGAGLVSVASREKHANLLSISRPEIMSHAVETPEQLMPLLNKASHIVIGPGLGLEKWGQQMFQQIVETELPCVVDADALKILSKVPRNKNNWVLTPHPGEAACLLACSTQQIAVDRFKAVDTLQARYGGVCVLKGAGTLLKDERRTLLSSTGNPGMASGGMGDVLTGIIAGILAQGVDMMEAAALAVYVHGLAADRLAEKAGERGLLAMDLLPEVRSLLNE